MAARSSLEQYEARDVGGLPTKRVSDIGAPDELVGELYEDGGVGDIAAMYGESEDLGFIGTRFGGAPVRRRPPPRRPAAPPGRAVSALHRAYRPTASASATTSTARALSPITAQRSGSLARNVDYNQLTQTAMAPSARSGGAAAVVSAFQAQPSSSSSGAPVSLFQPFSRTIASGGVMASGGAAQVVADYQQQQAAASGNVGPSGGATPIYQSPASRYIAQGGAAAQTAADASGGGAGGGGAADATGGGASADATGSSSSGFDPRSALTSPVVPREGGDVSGLDDASSLGETGVSIDPETGKIVAVQNGVVTGAVNGTFTGADGRKVTVVDGVEIGVDDKPSIVPALVVGGVFAALIAWGVWAGR